MEFLNTAVRSRALVSLAMLLLLLAPMAVRGQDSEGSEPDAAQQDQRSPEGQHPIPEEEVHSRGELVSADLRRLEELLRDRPVVSRIGEALTSREAEIVTLQVDLDRIDASRVSLRSLEDHRLPWLELREELDAWASAVQRRFGQLQVERQRLGDEISRWEATVPALEVAEAGPEVRRRSELVLAALLEMETRLRARRGEIVRVADRVAAAQEVVGDSLRRLDAISEGLRGRVLDRDAPVLWRSLGATEPRSLGVGMLEAGREWGAALGTYLERRRQRLIVVLVASALALIGLLRLRRRGRDGEAVVPDASAEARGLISRPFSLALMVALALSALLLPFPVGAFGDVATLLAIVAMIRLSTFVLGDAARRYLYHVAVASVLVRIAAAGPDGSAVTRLVLLLATVWALAGTISLPRRARRQDGGGPRRQRWILTAASVAGVGLGVALAANLFGWWRLSKTLAEGIILSVLAAFVWIIVVRATSALLPMIVHGPLGRWLPSLPRNLEQVRRTTVAGVGIVAVLAWTRGTLTRFRWWEPLRDRATDSAIGEFTIAGVTLSLGGLFAAIIIVAATVFVARLIGFGMREEVLPRLRVHPGATKSIITLTSYVVYAIGIVLAASALGLSGTRMTVVVGALGVGIGFGLQNIVNNFVSGIILNFERPIRVGDMVQTAAHWGRVTRIGIRASTIRSFDGAEIVVPNGDLIAKELTNWTRSDELMRLEVLVGVAYGTDPDKVLEILLGVAERHPLTLADPGPRAQMIRFGDSSLDFRLRCWTNVDDRVQVGSDLHVAIVDALKEAGITIPFPQRDLHVRSTVDLPRNTVNAEGGT